MGIGQHLYGFETNRIKNQLIRLFYPMFMLENEVKWSPLLSAAIIYCYCLQRLVTSLKFLNTKCDNYY